MGVHTIIYKAWSVHLQGTGVIPRGLACIITWCACVMCRYPRLNCVCGNRCRLYICTYVYAHSYMCVYVCACIQRIIIYPCIISVYGINTHIYMHVYTAWHVYM